MWRDWQQGKSPRAGGFVDQPLKYLSAVNAIEAIYNMLRLKATEGGFSKMTPGQMELLRWLERE